MDDLVIHRMNTAAEKLRSAQILLKEGQYRDSIGRSRSEEHTSELQSR